MPKNGTFADLTAYPVSKDKTRKPAGDGPFSIDKGVISLAEEINGQVCGLHDDPAPLPVDPVPAMAYVPFQQWSSSLHSPEKALESGTLFPVLDKPFLCGRRQRR